MLNVHTEKYLPDDENANDRAKWIKTAVQFNSMKIFFKSKDENIVMRISNSIQIDLILKCNYGTIYNTECK